MEMNFIQQTISEIDDLQPDTDNTQGHTFQPFAC